MPTKLPLVNRRYALGGAMAPSGEARCFAARDTVADRAVVLKCVAPRDAAARARLIAEFERLAALDHPSLPEVLELGEIEPGGPLPAGDVFFATELLGGEGAAAAVRTLRGSDRAARVAAIVADAADALGALHARGLCHHDVKPAHLIAAADGRFRLLDLGLVRPVGQSDGSVHGTLAYLSPDALAGSTDPAVDLYALGVSAYELLAGRLPFAAGDPATLLAEQAKPPPSLRGPRALTAIITSLMSIDPGARPSSARAVGEELARAGLLDEDRATRARAAHGALGRPGYVASVAGRGALLARLEATPAPLIALWGPPGSGKSRLVVELDRRRAVAALRAGRARAPLCGPSLTQAARQLGVVVAPSHDAGRARAALVAAVLDALDARSGLLHLVAPDAPTIAALLSAVQAGSLGRVILELAGERVAALPRDPRLEIVEVPPFDEEEVLALSTRLAGPSAADWARVAGRAARGRPGPLVDLLRAALARGPIDAEALRRVDLDVDLELKAVVRGLPGEARSGLAVLALLDRPASAEELAAAVDAPRGRLLDTLGASRLCDWTDGGLVADSRAVAKAALDALGEDERARMVTHLIAAADARGAVLEAALLARAAGRGDAGARAAAAVRALLDGEGALLLLDERLLDLAASSPQPARLEGELLLRRADYAAAAERLAAAEGAEAALLRARALRGAGRPREAASATAALIGDNQVGSGARTLLARLRLDEGDAQAAASALGADDDAAPIPVRRERAEIAGLAALQRGEPAAARVAFGALLRLLDHAPAGQQARAHALVGMVAQGEGALEDAATEYARALELADVGGDPHGAAVYAQNLGGTLRELGELARAEAPLRRACAVLLRVGRAEEQALAWFNLGNLMLSLGDLDGAERAVGEALARAGHDAGSRAALYARVLSADVLRRRGRHADAIAAYRAIVPGNPADRAVVEAALAEALAEAGDPAAAEAAQALARLFAQGELTADARAHLALAVARVQLATTTRPLGDELRRPLVADAAAADRSGRRVRCVELEVVLAQDAIRRGDLATVHARIATARRAHEEMLMRTPELRRAALADDPDVQRLRALAGALAPQAADDAPSHRLLEINKRLNSELDLDRLLGLILDTVLELTRAERGFVLLRGNDNALEVRSERNVDPDARAGAAAFSRSIADRAADAGEPIVTVDAAGDARFEAALSVSDLRLRSVLAMPLAVKGRVVGCVYVDHRARVGLFRPADVALVAALAEQAAIAVENARLLAENRARQVEVQRLNQALEQRLANQTVELEGMHREVRESRRRLGVRYDYEGLIGQTPRMLELFRLLDRVTDTALPVVIYGESGTGKELVARALHHNGPRRKAAFVSESCGAIPETLLEAALFGHVRGAFTGAQGERRGLFEIADGGTLFLDEVGETSPAMQVRLLRVLQEGEFRRVGGERVQKVDVRVVVASNRDLGRMVGEGKFREDLFYRLNVVRVALPPLRERADDIPLLVEHFLAGRKLGVTRRALDCLRRYAWPGNIRQLENEIARASSLADGPIDLPDLSPPVQAGTPEAETAGPEPLDLRARVERLERGLLEEALHRTAGNQSEAARLLGLSRFGLTKKLRRYRMSARATR